MKVGKQSVENCLMDRLQKKACVVLAEALDVTEMDVTVVALIGGMTNRNFLCSCEGQSYVVRIPGEGTRQMVDRSDEKLYTTMAVQHGWHPELIYFDHEGIKVTKYIAEANTLANGRGAEKSALQKVADILRNLHGEKISGSAVFSFADTYQRYCNMVSDRGNIYFTHPNFKEIEEMLGKWQERLSVLGIESVPCHNDLVPENWLITDTHLYLLDWEYAGYHDRAWDLASYISESGLSDEAVSYFLDCYFSKRVDRLLWEEKILIYEGLQHVLWFVWTLVKEAQGVSFPGYAQKRLDGALVVAERGHKKYGWKV